MLYNVYIDSKYWGSFTSNKPKNEFQKEMQANLKTLAPINMSPEGIIEYRKRFENSTVWCMCRAKRKLSNHG
jgi:hypothetical protein